MFVVCHYARNNLSSALIFSTLELMVFLRVNLFFLAIGVGFIYELNVIFERFVNVLNIVNTQMVEIDPTTQKPLEKAKRESKMFGETN